MSTAVIGYPPLALTVNHAIYMLTVIFPWRRDEG
jgi:hypothetical protein